MIADLLHTAGILAGIMLFMGIANTIEIAHNRLKHRPLDKQAGQE